MNKENKLIEKKFKTETFAFKLECIQPKCKGEMITIAGAGNPHTGEIAFYENVCQTCKARVKTKLQYPRIQSFPIGESISEEEIEPFDEKAIKIVRQMPPQGLN